MEFGETIIFSYPQFITILSFSYRYCMADSSALSTAGCSEYATPTYPTTLAAEVRIWLYASSLHPRYSIFGDSINNAGKPRDS